MLKTLIGFLCVCFSLPAQGKLGETVPQLVKRFGKSYTIESDAIGKRYRFRSEKLSVDVLVSDDVSVAETYFSAHPLTGSGEPPNDIVRAILKTNAPRTRWVEMEAVPFRADYALQSSDQEYIALLKYTGLQPEGSVWTMTVGLAKSVRTLSSITPSSANPSPPASTASAGPHPSPTAPTTVDLWQTPDSTATPSFFAPVTPAPSTETGDQDSEYQLGVRHVLGDGVEKNLAEAVKWFRKAAEQNYAPAQFILGVCYDGGQGVTQNYTEAVKWYRKAAEQNHAEAQFYLGSSYANGQGVTKNEAAAVKWYRKAAEQGFASAQHNLGLCYANGQGVTQNYTEAVKWYRKAAEQGFASAQGNLGLCYAEGKGVTKNDAEAVKWYRKAAEQNDASAQNNLGIYYATGRGVTKDYVEGYKWMLLAAAQGAESDARFSGAHKANIEILENKMSREQIAEGQRLARDFKPREVPPEGEDRSGAAIAEMRPRSSGSGFFITDDGYLITNEHVAGNGAHVRLVTATGITSAKVINVDAANDLALLKAEGRFSALPVATSRTVKLGDTVMTIGFPNVGLQGFAPKFARGEIGSLSGPQDDARYFQISVPLQPGNSGGALVDERGNVIGVVSAMLSAKAALAASGALPQNVNYAVKGSFLLGFLESVPEVAAKLKEPNTEDRKSADLVEQAKEAAVLVLVY